MNVSKTSEYSGTTMSSKVSIVNDGKPLCVKDHTGDRPQLIFREVSDAVLSSTRPAIELVH